MCDIGRIIGGDERIGIGFKRVVCGVLRVILHVMFLIILRNLINNVRTICSQ